MVGLCMWTHGMQSDMKMVQKINCTLEVPDTHEQHSQLTMWYMPCMPTLRQQSSKYKWLHNNDLIHWYKTWCTLPSPTFIPARDSGHSDFVSFTLITIVMEEIDQILNSLPRCEEVHRWVWDWIQWTTNTEQLRNHDDIPGQSELASSKDEVGASSLTVGDSRKSRDGNTVQLGEC